MNRLFAEIIGLLLAIIAIIGGYFYGQHIGDKNGYARRDTETLVQIAKLNAENQQKTDSLVQQMNDKEDELQKVKEDAKKQIAKLNADIATGKLQLYVKVKPTSNCSSPNAPTPSRPDTATAQLDPTFAQSIVSITEDGDKAIRQLNSCIDAYNAVRAK